MFIGHLLVERILLHFGHIKWGHNSQMQVTQDQWDGLGLNNKAVLRVDSHLEQCIV